MVLSKLLQGGGHLFKAEVPGHVVTRLKPKISHTARILWLIYGLFTIMEITLLYAAFKGLGYDHAFYDAVNHTFTTLSTGGFGTHVDSIAYYDSVYVDTIIICFMFLAGMNFVLFYFLFKGRFSILRNDPEFRFYFLIVAFAFVFIVGNLMMNSVYGLRGAMRYGLFQVLTIQTTTGYATANFAEWPHSIQFILLVLMLIGGCAGSTAGGVKVVRTVLLLKMARREVRQVTHPKAIMHIRIAGQIIPERVYFT